MSWGGFGPILAPFRSPGSSIWLPLAAKGSEREAKERPREAKGIQGDAKGGQGEAKGGQREAKGRPRRGQGRRKGEGTGEKADLLDLFK